MSERAPYSRIYWSVMDDPKFDGIRENVRHLGSWTLVLLVADMAYPAPTFAPPAVPKASLEALVAAGLIDSLSGGRIRLHGLEAERNRRRDAATREPKRSPTGTQQGPNRDPVASQAEDEPSRDETSQAETPRDPADIYYQLTAKYPGDKVLPWIDDLTGKYGAEAVIRHLVAAHIEDRTVATLLGRTTDRLRAEARELDRKERAAEKASLEEKRALPKTVEPWREEYRAAIEAKYRDMEGAA